MIYSITAFGLLLVLKCCIFGISSDAVIVYPLCRRNSYGQYRAASAHDTVKESTLTLQTT